MSRTRHTSGKNSFWAPANAAIVVAGILLRVWYLIVTPITVRGYDTGTHLEYIKYLVTHATLPPVNAGWEFHQAPLYYILAAWVWVINGFWAVDIQATTLPMLRIGSLLLSIGTFFIALRIGRMLLQHTRDRLTFGALLAGFPGLIYLAGALSNETLHHCLMFLGFLLLLRWWKSGRNRDLAIVSAVIGIGILTKITSFILALSLGCCILARPKMQARERWRSLGIAVVILTLLCGWFVALRISEHADIHDRIVSMDSLEMVERMRVKNDPSYFLQFSPAMIMRSPFNAMFDTDQRRYFWEYFFRSAWFGEWTFTEVQPLGTVMLTLGLSMLAFAIFGMGKDLRERPPYAFPVAITTFLLPLALVSYRLAFPCACNQDFRFISLLCVPMTYYALRGIGGLPERFRILGYAIAWLMAMASAIFILLLG